MLPGVYQNVLCTDATELAHRRSHFHEVGSCSDNADDFHSVIVCEPLGRNPERTAEPGLKEQLPLLSPLPCPPVTYCRSPLRPRLLWIGGSALLPTSLLYDKRSRQHPQTLSNESPIYPGSGARTGLISESRVRLSGR